MARPKRARGLPVGGSLGAAARQRQMPQQDPRSRRRSRPSWWMQSQWARRCSVALAFTHDTPSTCHQAGNSVAHKHHLLLVLPVRHQPVVSLAASMYCGIPCQQVYFHDVHQGRCMFMETLSMYRKPFCAFEIGNFDGKSV